MTSYNNVGDSITTKAKIKQQKKKALFQIKAVHENR